jgi:hypothetical protein
MPHAVVPLPRRSRRKGDRAALVAGLPLLVLCACSEPPSHRYEFVIRVQSDPGRPLANAFVRFGTRTMGPSKEHGAIVLGTHGVEGERIQLSIECPEGHVAPEAPLTVQLRKSGDGKRPEYPVSCPPTQRTLVIAVRAANGPHLPVRYLGQELTKTDSKGAAHVLIKAAPNEDLQLVLDTSSHPELRPQNPSVRFQASQQDDIFVFDHEFVVAKTAPRRAARPAGKKPSGPIKIR